MFVSVDEVVLSDPRLLSVTVATHPGRVRHENQDQFCVNGLVSGGSEQRALTIPIPAEAGLVLGVVDGMGGHAGGRTAARVVAEALAEPREQWIGLADQMSLADARLYDLMDHDPTLRGMGATVVVLLVDEHGWTICNVGDARAYLHQDSYSVVVSTDDRVRGAEGVISQSIGGADRPIAFQPHVSPLEVEAGNRLLLCTDGLSDVVSLSTIQQTLEEVADLERAVDDLVTTALEGGAPDNITVAAIEVPAWVQRATTTSSEGPPQLDG